MKLSALFLAGMAASAAAFAPSTTAPATSSSQLNVITGSEMFDINTGRAYDRMTYGRRGAPMTYRPGGTDYFRGRSGGYSESKIEGNSRRTFDMTYSESSQIELETDGRPLNAKVEVWEGPSNTPAKMKLWSEDGARRPWGPVGFGNFASGMRGDLGTSITVDNEGPSEFPIYYSVGERSMRYMGTSRRQTLRIDGNGAQKSFTFRGPIIIEIWSEGFPYYADVEVWDGPNNVKQSAQVYADDGMSRPWSALIESPMDSSSSTRGSGGTIQIKNVGPLEYPILVSVEELGGYDSDYYGGGYY